jgi:hypothetical protein
MTSTPTPDHARIGGRTYVPQPSPHNVHSCAGCAASSTQLQASEQNTLCRALPTCFAGGRTDGKNVVWVPAPKGSFIDRTTTAKAQP